MKLKQSVALILCAVMLSGMMPGNIFYVSAEEILPTDINESVEPELSFTQTETGTIVSIVSDPTTVPTPEPTVEPTPEPTAVPTAVPTSEPTAVPAAMPTPEPTAEPTPIPEVEPTSIPSTEPTTVSTPEPTAVPTPEPTAVLTPDPTAVAIDEPTIVPTPEPLFTEGYALVKQNNVPVHAQASSGSRVVTLLSRDDSVFVSQRRVADEAQPEKDWLFAHFNTSEGPAEGFMRAEYLEPCTQAETDALLGAIRGSGSSAIFNGHPLMLLDCELMPETAPEPTPEPATDLTPEPLPDSTPEPTPEVTPEPTEETTPQPTEQPALDPTSEPTQEPTPEPTPVESPVPTPEESEPQGSVSILIDPLFATPGDTVTLTATVTGYEGASFQWQWAAIPAAIVKEILSAEEAMDGEPLAAADDAVIHGEAAESLVWHDEPEATGLSYQFKATPENLNRYWRMVLTLPETSVEEIEEGEKATYITLLASLLIPEAKADGGTVIVTDGFASMMSAQTIGETVSVTSVTLDVSELTISQAYELTVVVLPEDATDKSLSWSSSDQAIATVRNGLITPLRAGTCDIVATAKDESGFSGVCKVTVQEPISGITSEGYNYSISNGDVVITGYTGTSTALSIPAQIEGLPVRSLGKDAFRENRNIQAVYLPSGMTRIEETAFYLCENLSMVNIPSTVVHIGWLAFSNCYSLSSITIPSGVTEIMGSAFSSCRSITSITIPFGVTKIGSRAFEGCRSLTSITIPDSVTQIDQAAFWGCNFTSITIPYGVTEIAKEAFYVCKSLTSISIPSSVTSIGIDAFRGCTSLTNIEIPSSVTEIGYDAFAYCSGLVSIDIPEKVKRIERGTFQNCNNLSSISLPDGLTYLGDIAFENCTGLTSIDIPDTVTRIEYGAFQYCNSLTSLDLPSQLVTISDSAFNHCISLASINIPSGAVQIGSGAFQNCWSLMSVTIPRSVSQISANAFSSANASLTLYGYAGSYAETFAVSQGLPFAALPEIYIESIELNANSLSMREGEIFQFTAAIAPSEATDKRLSWTSSDPSVAAVTSQGQVLALATGTVVITAAAVNDGGIYALCNISIQEIVIDPAPLPDGLIYSIYNSEVTITGYTGISTALSIPAQIEGMPVRNIGKDAFRENRNLQAVYLPSGMTRIEENAFYLCENLSTVNIPSTVGYLSWGAFSNCYSLSSISIPWGLTEINSGTFASCYNITSITIPDSVISIGQSAFSGCQKLTSITIPDSVKSIGIDAFRSCVSLSSIAIPLSVTSIGIGAFRSCTSLESITIPSSVIEIGYNAFEDCRGLIAIDIHNGLKRIESGTFENCTSLKFVTLSNGLTHIGSGTFRNCIGLTTIDIPDSVTWIEGSAFYGCSNLISVGLPSRLLSISEYTFYGCVSLTSIDIPSSAGQIKERAFQNCWSLISVTIPRSVNQIDATAFNSANASLTLYGYAGSYAETFAASQSLPFEALPEVYIESIELNAISLSMREGEIIQLTAAIAPSEATDKRLSWTSSDPSVAAVTSQGQVLALGVGTTTIAAMANDSMRVYDSCTLTVIKTDNGIEISPSLSTIDVNESLQLEMIVSEPEDVIPVVTWSSSNPQVATVDSFGMVTAVSPGSAIVSAYAQDGSARRTNCIVNVIQKVTEILISSSSYTLFSGSSQQLLATVLPTNASNTSLIWSSSHEEIASVNNDGFVIANVPGKTTISATALDGSGATASIEITVEKSSYEMSSVKWDYDAAFVFNRSEHSVRLSGLPSGVTVSEYYGNTAKNAGTYTASAILSYDEIRFEQPIVGELTWSILKGSYDLSNTAWDYPGSFIYDGTVRTVAVGNLPEGVTVASYTGDKEVNAGSYTASAILSYDEENYVKPEIADLTWEIQKAQGSVSDISDISKVYDGMPVSDSTYTKLGDGTVSIAYYTGTIAGDDLSAEPFANPPVNAGSYTVVVSIAEGTNHLPVAASRAFTISKATYDMSGTMWDYTDAFTYDGTVKTVSAIGLPDGVSVTSYSDSSKVNAGTYTASAILSYDEENYVKPEIADLTWTIQKAHGGVSGISDISKVYDGSPVSDPVFTKSGDGVVSITYYTGTSAGGDLSPEPLASAPVNAGSYTVVVSVAEGTNHLPAAASHAFTISKAAYDMSGAKWDYTDAFTYDGTVRTVSVVNLPEGVSIASYTGNSEVNTGGYTSSAILSYDEENYVKPEIADLTWTIQKAHGSVSGISDISKEYDASPVSEPAFSKSGDGAASIAYYTGTSAGGDLSPEPLASAPVNAGSYTVVVSVAEGTNHLPVAASRAFTISKATYDMSGTMWDYTDAFIYDGTVKTVSAIGLPDGVSVTSYSDSSKVNAGTYTASAILSYDGENYVKPEIANLTWEIQKVQESIIGISDISKEYDGSPISDPSFTKLGDGAVSVAYYAGTSAGGDLSAEPLGGKPLNAGSYTVVISVAEGTNHLPATASRAFTIDKDDYDMTGAKWNYTDAFTYDGTVKTVLVTGLPAGLTIASYSGNTATSTGTYTASATFDYDAQNYEVPTIAPLTWTISKAAYDMSGVKWDYTSALPYDGTVKTVLVTGLPTGVTVASYSGNTATNTGTYTASATLNYDTQNYEVPTIAPLTWTISKAAYDMSGAKWDYTSALPYDGTVKTVLVTGLPTGVTVASYSGNTATNTGTYTASATLNYDTQNYEVPTIASLTWTISKATYDMSGAKWDYTSAFSYNGTEKAVQVIGLPDGVSVASYSDSSKMNAGVYTASAILSCDEENYVKPEIADLTWTIQKAQGSVSDISDISKVYDGSPVSEPSFTKSGDGAVSIAYYTGTSVGGDLSEEPLANAPVNAGSYAVVISVAEGTNHLPAAASRAFIISKATYDMSGAKWDYTNAFTYNGTVKTVSVINLPKGVSVASYGGNSEVDAGGYTSSAILSCDEENYVKPEIADLTWTIQKAQGSVSDISDISKVYDGSPVSEPSFTKSGDGAVSIAYYTGTSVGGDLSPEPLANAPIIAGSYTVVVSVAEGTNHLPVAVSRAFTINKAAYDMSGAKWDYTNAFTYNGTVKTVSVINLPKGVSVASYGGNSEVDAGGYTSSAILSCDEENYVKPEIADLTWTIQKAQGSVSDISDISKVYDGSPVSEPTFTKAGDGDVSITYYSGTNADGDLSDEPLADKPTNAGSYTAVVSVTEGVNHLAASVLHSFTISKADYDISGAEWDYTDAFIYDGTEKTVQVTGLPNGVSVVSYSKNAAVNAGEYTASGILDYDTENYNQPILNDLTWTIEKSPGTIALRDSQMTITKTYSLAATVIPENPEPSLLWNSSNPAVASVDANGNVTSLMEGECIITVEDRNTTALPATCTIRVKYFTYSLNGSEAIITGYSGSDKSLHIPGVVDGIPVTAIGERAFSERADFTGSLTIPSGIRSIGVSAFIGCSGLTGSLQIPDSVTVIEDGAFDRCSGFTGDLIIPDSVVSIGSIAFALCDGFTGNLKIGNNVRSIGSDAFTGCSGFTGDLVIPDSVTSIGSGAFYECSGFNGRLVISKSLNSIEDAAFRSCSGLTGDLVIPENVTNIGEGAFDSCGGLTGNLLLPKSITSIGQYAFYYCSGLSSAFLLSESYDMYTSSFLYSAPIFYGYNGTALQEFSQTFDLTFIPFGITITGDSTMPVFSSTQVEANAVWLPGETETISWTSSDESIATVDQSGLVTGIAPGLAVITAASYNFTVDFIIEVVKATYDMSNARWDYTSSFSYDGTEKTVQITGLPDGVAIGSYSGNKATNPGTYTASVTFTYDAQNFNTPVIAPLTWTINAPILDTPAISSVESLSSTSLKIAWDSVPLATGYVLERATSASGTYKAVYTGALAAFTDTGLTAGKVYYYRVSAIGTVDEILYTSPASLVKAGSPFAGTSVTRTETVSATSIKITYGAAAGITGYQLYRSNALDGEYARVYSGTATAFTNAGLTAGTAYYYKVRTYKKIGTSTYYSTFSAPKPAMPIAAPSTPAVSAAGGTSVTATWKAVTGASGYQLYRSTSSAGTYTRVYSGTGLTYTNTGLSAGKAYYYKVRAYATIGGTTLYGLYSAAKAGVPLAAPAISSAAAAGSTSIKVSWGSASSATGYQLYRSTSEAGTYAKVYSGTARTYTNTGLTTGRAYYYKVRAYKVIGSTTYYGPYGAVKTGVPLAAAKTPTVTVIDSTSVKASWSAVTGASGYQLYRSTSSTGTYTRVYSGPDRTYINTGLSAGKAYYYKVRAYTVVGSTTVYGPYSTAKAVVPLAAPAISSAAAAGSTSIKVSWGSASSATGYQLYRSTSEAGTYSKIYSGTAKSYTNTGLTTGRAYYYKVRAYKVIGSTTYYGPYGAVKAGVPLAAAKTPTVSVIDGTNVKASWSAVTGAAGYQLYRSTSSTGAYTSVYTGTERTFTDTALTTGTTYYYKVRAYKLVGTTNCYGPFSAYKSIKPM